MTGKKIISRRDAKAVGATRYFTGVACPHGHVCERMVSNCACVECGRARDVARDKEKISASNKRYHSDNKDRINARKAEYRKGNDEYRDRRRELQRRTYHANRQRFLEKNRQWRADNAPAVLAANRKRKEAINRAVPGYYGEFDDLVITEAFRLSALRKRTCGMRWNVDHMIPLNAVSASGLHVWNNIQVIPEALNFIKRNSMTYTEPGLWLSAINGDRNAGGN